MFGRAQDVGCTTDLVSVGQLALTGDLQRSSSSSSSSLAAFPYYPLLQTLMLSTG